MRLTEPTGAGPPSRYLSPVGMSLRAQLAGISHNWFRNESIRAGSNWWQSQHKYRERPAVRRIYYVIPSSLHTWFLQAPADGHSPNPGAVALDATIWSLARMRASAHGARALITHSNGSGYL